MTDLDDAAFQRACEAADADWAEGYGERLQEGYQARMEELDAAGALDPPADDDGSGS